MQQTLPLSSSQLSTRSPAAAPSPAPSTRCLSMATQSSSLPAIISCDYSYQSTMSPTSYVNTHQSPNRLSASEDDLPYRSLFGEPACPSQLTDYMDVTALSTFCSGSSPNEDEDEDELVAAVTLNTLQCGKNPSRLFADVPYASSSHCAGSRQFHRLPPPVPRVQPPDIQILPDSSADSSSEKLHSPNFMLLTPEDTAHKPILRRPSTGFQMLDKDADEQLSYAKSIPDTPCNANVTSAGTPCTSKLRCQSSNDSYCSAGWFRPDMHSFVEPSRIPKLRPSSKRVMSMKHEEMPPSPLATMLQDSNASSSGSEERQPIDSPASTLATAQTAELRATHSPKPYLAQHEGATPSSMKTSPCHTRDYCCHRDHTAAAKSMADLQLQSPKRERIRTPIIMKDSVSLGGDYRVEQARLHKKTAFTIISVVSPLASRSHSPHISPILQRRASTVKPISNERRSSNKSTTTTTTFSSPRPAAKLQHDSRLPHMPIGPSQQHNIDDSPRPSVQFNMTGRLSPSKVLIPPKGILQQRDSLTSSVDTYTPRAQRRLSDALALGPKIKSLETLPLITEPYRRGILPQHQSANELDKHTDAMLRGPLPAQLKPHLNPTRKQRGLLRVMSHEQLHYGMPRRTSWLSLQSLNADQQPISGTSKLLEQQARRRSSSTSMERRSSTQTASDRRSSNLSSITTSDFSYQRYKPASRRPSTIAAPRRSSIYNRSIKPRNKPAKIAKPTSLSPIVGTPNRDSSSQHSPMNNMADQLSLSDTAVVPSNLYVHRPSISRIPIRNRAKARRSSVLKQLSGNSSRLLQSAGHRTRAHGALRNPKNAAVTAYSNFRLAETPSPRLRGMAKDSAYRPQSRLEEARQTPTSRANSQLSLRSSLRSLSKSPVGMSNSSRGTTPNRRKSISTSARNTSRTNTPTHMKSPEPAAKQPARSASRASTKVLPSIVTPQRRNSRFPTPTVTSHSIARSGAALPKRASDNVAKSAKLAKAPLSGKGHNRLKPLENNKAKSKLKPPPSAKKSLSDSKPNKLVVGVRQPKSAGMPSPPAKPFRRSAVPPAGKAAAMSGKKLNNDIKRPPSRTATQKALQHNADTKAAVKAKPVAAPAAATAEAGKTVEAAAALDDTKSSKVTMPQAEGAAATASSTVNTPTMPVIKRQGSNMSTLARMSSRLSLISNKKRVGSAQSQSVRTVYEDTSQTDDSAVPESAKHDAKPSALTDELQLQHAAAAPEAAPSTLETPSTKTTKKPATELHTAGTAKQPTLEPKAKGNDNGLALDCVTSPALRYVTEVDKPSESASRIGTADGGNSTQSAAEQHKPTEPVTHLPIEATVSVVNADGATAAAEASAAEPAIMDTHDRAGRETSGDEFKENAKRRSPDGQGGSTRDSSGLIKTDSQEFLEAKDSTSARGCCRCCSSLFMPCRRLRCSQCCSRLGRKTSVEKQPVLSSGRSSGSTVTNLEVIDETKPKKKATKCWPQMACCRLNKKKSPISNNNVDESLTDGTQLEKKHDELLQNETPVTRKGKCGLCLSKFLCCRSVNKVDPTRNDQTERKKCCFCIPYRGKRREKAWEDVEQGITTTEAAVTESAATALPAAAAAASATSNVGCCKRFWNKILCCRKEKRSLESRRESIRPPPPSEDTRRKLHNDLVEYTSKMKAAIPVLPLYLAWFCALLNIIFPGLGTLLSGVFCLCVGIPRFSQFDSARARIGSFIINIIVAVAQFFCVLFCFVGWGWSIWWGTIMLKCAKKLSKIKKVERLELEEEQRQTEILAGKNASHGEDASKI